MAVATSYNVTSTQGARENLENTLRFVEPTVTPLYSTLKQSAAPKAVLNEWLADVLAAPEIGGVLDGVDMSFNADFTDQINSRVRLGNRVQTIRRSYAVSRQAQMIDVAPGESLLAASKAKSLLELKRDIETCIGSGASQRAGTGSVKALSQGLGVWTDPAAVTADIPASVRSVSGSRFNLTESAGGNTMTESDLRALLQAVYEASGSKTDFRLFAGPSVLNEISDMSRASAGSATFNQEVGGGRLSLSITEYQSDYGSLKCFPALFLGREESKAITASTSASPSVITSAGHGLSNGDKITITNSLVNTAINGIRLVTNATTDTFKTTDTSGAAINGNGTGTTGEWVRGTNTTESVLNSNRAYLLPGDDTVSLKFLEGITSQNLPDLAAGPRAFVEAMVTLCVTNPRALGSII
jgi:hypothetical protein